MYVLILIVYVDEIILTSDDEASLHYLKKSLASEFKIKDLVTLKYFLERNLQDQIRASLLINKNMLWTYLKKWDYSATSSRISY